jgi:hypothetical protein
MNSSAPLLLVFEEWRGRLSKHGKFGFMTEALSEQVGLRQKAVL